MNFLLDTHIWLWSQLEPKKLGRRVTAELSNTANELWISPVSVWEALTLMQRAAYASRIPMAGPNDTPNNCEKRR